MGAIGSNTVITVRAGRYDLTSAADYGAEGAGAGYMWSEAYDGYELEISGVSNLAIKADGDVEITTAPRYANVIRLSSCTGVTLSGFTAGHTEEPGSCSGGVLCFDGCSDISIAGCRLYGCGTVGIQADTSRGLDVRNTEIYDCSACAVNLVRCTGAVFTNCNIHDCGTPELYFDGSSGIIYDGAELAPAVYAIGADGAPVSPDV